jgi:hypothetical protein
VTQTTTYPLRLPRSLKEAVERQSREDGTSIIQFVATAVAEKLSAMQTAEFFSSRQVRADFKAFDKIMKRRSGKAPRQGDEMPPAAPRPDHHEAMKRRRNSNRRAGTRDTGDESRRRGR